jgi:pilus assembly protein Flp/PilA
MQMIDRFLSDDSGSNALEYGLIVALVSLAVVTGATAAGTALGSMFTAIGTKLTTLTTSISG